MTAPELLAVLERRLGTIHQAGPREWALRTIEGALVDAFGAGQRVALEGVLEHAHEDDAELDEVAEAIELRLADLDV
jgi:hypothetical protein